MCGPPVPRSPPANVLPDVPAEETFTPCVRFSLQSLALLFPCLPGIEELITPKAGDKLMDKGEIKKA